MRENGIKVVRTQKYKATTDSDHTFNIAPNLLDQDFTTDAPNQKWAGDISYIWTSEGWLYLAVILDLYSRRVIGWTPLVNTAYRLPGNGQQSHEAGPSDPGVGHGCGAKATARRLHSSYGSWVAILFQRVSATAVKAWLQGLPLSCM
jgi:hypothetical protein